MTDQQPQRFRFSGTGDEYFRIWIVNVCLSIVTLGIYSAWAKVRRNQYFYRHTSLAGASFDYHGEPKAILKGRIAAVLMFFMYSLASSFNPNIGAMVFLAILAIMPWLLVRSLRFRLHNTSYRGLRFAFHGSYGNGYLNFMLWPGLCVLLLLGILWPYAQQRIARYIRTNSAYGSSFFNFSAKPRAYYRVYFDATLFATLAGVCVAAVGAVLTGVSSVLFATDTAQAHGWLWMISMFVVIYLAAHYTMIAMQNLVWNSTSLDEHCFYSCLSVREILGITISNLLLIVLTLGLYKPYADIRMARYRLEHLELLPQGSIDDFVAGQQTQATAVGDEMADMFDLDIAL